MAKHFEKKIKDKKKVKLNKSKIIIFLILLVIFLFAFINLLRWFIYNKRTENLTKDMAEYTSFEENTDNKNTNPVNFDELKKVNSDVVAWINIEKAGISYPVVKADNNDYYLHRDINKKYNTCGWIFMDYKNSPDFIDKNTVIYGHNLKLGLMFEPLQKIVNNELGTDITIDIYTEKEKLMYKVFSSYIENPEDYAIKSNIVTDEDQEKFITEMLKRSSTEYNLIPDKKDNILTLSTCDKTGKKRIIIHAVCTEKEIYNQ